MDIKIKKREITKERAIAVTPRFLSWAALWVMLLSTEKINREEAVLEVARVTKMNLIWGRFILSMYETLKPSRR